MSDADEAYLRGWAQHRATRSPGSEIKTSAPCEVCGYATRERGNGEANLCHLHDPVRTLGARVLEILTHPDDLRMCGSRNPLLLRLESMARSLGLLEEPLRLCEHHLIAHVAAGRDGGTECDPRECRECLLREEAQP